MCLQVTMLYPSPQIKPSISSNPQIFFGVDSEVSKLIKLFEDIVPKLQKTFVHCVQEKKELDPPLGNLSISKDAHSIELLRNS